MSGEPAGRKITNEKFLKYSGKRKSMPEKKPKI